MKGKRRFKAPNCSGDCLLAKAFGVLAVNSGDPTPLAVSTCEGEHTPLACCGFGSSPKRTFHATTCKIEMSTITEIQKAIDRLPTKEKSALTTWLQSQEDQALSETEEAALLARLDKAAAELDAGKGIPIERVREKIRGWANYIL